MSPANRIERLPCTHLPPGLALEGGEWGAKMVVLILGLVIFLGSHAVRLFAEDWRAGMIARLGEGPWKGIFSLVSLVGLVLIVWGYGLSRPNSMVIWEPPVWTQHIAILLNLIA